MTASAVVSRRFAEYLSSIEPSDDAISLARQRTNGIHAALARSVAVARVARVGSLYKGTAIHGAGDLDFFVVLRRDAVRHAGKYVASTTVLSHVRNAIVDRYPRSAVGRDQSAVVVAFGNGIPIDVVPAVFADPLRSGNPLYEIPDGDGGWLTTSPDEQRSAFAIDDERSGGKLRRALQLVKAWARYRQTPLPISSFYVESVLASEGIASGVRPYSLILSDAFRVLAARGSRSLQDPLGISGYIRPAKTEAQRASLAASMSFASNHADAAYDAECLGDSREAVRQWRILFRGFRAL